MAVNAAGLDVSGSNNQKWKGGLLTKTCEVCEATYHVKRVHHKSRFCSLQCTGISQRGVPSPRKSPPRRVFIACETCGEDFSVFTSHAHRYHCCSKACSHKRRSALMKGETNPNWNGGLSRMPYPWNFREISRRIIERDGFKCMNPDCAGSDERMTTHHINYDKQDCRDSNLICLCSACNSKANFGRERWQALYSEIVSALT